MESVQAANSRSSLMPGGRVVMQMQTFVWSESARATNSVCSLPRLRGRGGEGVSGYRRVQMNLFACPLDLVACPLPIPPPRAGEGAHRARGDAFAFNATQFSQGDMSSQTLPPPTAAE